jgi:hypothetical protein
MRIPLPRTPGALASATRRWSDSSLTGARRNAMVALTALAQRRAEREDAEAFLEDVARRRGALPQPRRSSGGSR